MKLKAELKEMFKAPQPKGSEQFFKTFKYPRATYLEFILGQVGFIRKSTWAASVVFVVTALGVLHVYTADETLHIIWVLSSLLPFVTLMITRELFKSVSYHMAELEKSCKYSLEHIILVRLAALGSFNFILFGILLFSLSGHMGIGLLRLSSYLFVPSLLSCLMSVTVVSKMNDQEVTYTCAGISGGVSVLNTMMMVQWTHLFSAEYTIYWVGMMVVLIGCLIVIGRKELRRMEALAWNLSLTA